MNLILPLAVFFVAAFCVWAVLCRLNHMGRQTYKLVAAQHIQLGLACFSAPIAWHLAGPEVALLVVLVSIACYLLAGSSRWRDGAPSGTLRKRQEANHVPVSNLRGVPSDRSAGQRMPQDGSRGG